MGEKDVAPLTRSGQNAADLETARRLLESGTRSEPKAGEILLAQAEDKTQRSWQRAIDSAFGRGKAADQPPPRRAEPEKEAPIVPRNPSPLGKDYYDWLAEKRRSIVEHEKASWNWAETGGKVVLGSLAGLRGGGAFAMPNQQEVFRLGQIATERAAYTQGGQARQYANALAALRNEEQTIEAAYRARGVRSTMGGLGAGWLVSYGIDRLFFKDDQTMEATLIGDVAGVGLAIVLPRFGAKTIGVIGSHVIGKIVDHYRQPVYQFDREKKREQELNPGGGSNPGEKDGYTPRYKDNLNPKYFQRRV